MKSLAKDLPGVSEVFRDKIKQKDAGIVFGLANFSPMPSPATADIENPRPRPNLFEKGRYFTVHHFDRMMFGNLGQRVPNIGLGNREPVLLFGFGQIQKKSLYPG